MDEKVIYESSMDFESLNEEQEVVLDKEDVTFSGDIKVVASENPYVLGKLVGTFMEINNDNGNGRLYPLETIKTRVVELPYTKRMMEHKSLLGEAHHPDERTNIWMDESAISTTKLEITPDGKFLYGEADILDTPKGRIINTLARYGTDVGISARATGKGTKRGGHLVITPDKYFFKTFDAVLNPGFTSARPSKLEADGSPMKVYEEQGELGTLYEELKSQIEQNKCDSKMLEYYINYSGDEKLKELQSLFEDNNTTDESSLDKGDVDMTEIEELKEENTQLNEENKRLQAKIENLMSDVASLQEEKEVVSDRLNFINEQLGKDKDISESQVDELLDILYQQKNELFGLNEELKDIQYRYAGLSSQVITLNEQKNEDNYDIALLESQVDSLQEELEDRKEAYKEKTADVEEEMDEDINEEEVKTPREKVIPSKVDLFTDSVEAVNEETIVKEVNTPNPNNRRVSMIRSLGGK